SIAGCAPYCRAQFVEALDELPPRPSLGPRHQISFVLVVSCISFATSRDRIKGTKKSGGGLFGARLLSSSLSPVGAMFHDPIQQSSFKADVFPGFFALDPLVLQNFCALRKKLLVKRRFFNELRLLCFRRRHVRLLFFPEIST